MKLLRKHLLFAFNDGLKIVVDIRIFVWYNEVIINLKNGINMKLYDGMRVKGKISDDKFVGVITEEDGKFYICQNVRNGESCKEKKGFKYSLCIGDGSEIDARINNASDLHPLDDSIENIYVQVVS